jgi:hypothetical protein
MRRRSFVLGRHQLVGSDLQQALFHQREVVQQGAQFGLSMAA